MTSVSGYKIYSTNCCQAYIKIAVYASLSRKAARSQYKCICGKNISTSEMELERTERNDGGQIPSGGFDDFQLPEFSGKTG